MIGYFTIKSDSDLEHPVNYLSNVDSEYPMATNKETHDVLEFKGNNSKHIKKRGTSHIYGNYL
jgi:hypothetical protein